MLFESRQSTLLRKSLTATALAAGLIATALPQSARADQAISVELDRAKIMRLARPASTVILGNPSIADATIQDSQTLIITGHSFGTTNLVVLDRNGQAVADQLITVRGAENNLVTVYAGANRQSYSCEPDCQPVMSIGDSTSFFSDVKGKFDTRNGLAQGAAAGN